MASEMSTAGIKLYCTAVTAGAARPALTDISTEIPDVTSIPAIDSAPEGLECTPLSETVWKRYIAGLKDPGSDIAIVANDTTSFRTTWATSVTNAATKDIWYKITIPNRDAFVFKGVPGALGFNGAEVNSVAQLTGHIVPNTISGFLAS